MNEWPRHVTGPIDVPREPAHHGMMMKLAAGLLGALLGLSIYIWTGMVTRVDTQDEYHAEQAKEYAEHREADRAEVQSLKEWRAVVEADRERWIRSIEEIERLVIEYRQMIRESKRRK